VWRLQESQLHGNEKQEEAPGSAGDEEVLPVLSAPHGAQRSKVTSDKRERNPGSSLVTEHSSLLLKGRQING
jgi:hypothetical protein